MEQLPGFVAQGESGLVCKLYRSLYGLKQSPQAWFSRFSSVIQEFGIIRSTTDHSIFFIIIHLLDSVFTWLFMWMTLLLQAMTRMVFRNSNNTSYSNKRLEETQVFSRH